MAEAIVTVDDDLAYACRPQVTAGHLYSVVNASGNAKLHLGDIHYHNHPQKSDAREQLLSSLHFHEMFVRYDNIDDPHSDTFTWVLKPPDPQSSVSHSFLEWLHSDGNIFWVSGKPGSGKSVLMKYLAQNIENELRRDNTAPKILSFWFWEAAHEKLQRSLIGCLRSLLWQALQSQANDVDIFEACKQYVSFEWTMKRLRDALDLVLRSLYSSFVRPCLILDGLDESSTDPREILDFVRDLSRRHPGVKICVSSRPEPIFQLSLTQHPYLKMQDLNEPDVRAIVRQDLFGRPEITSLPDHLRELQDLGEDLVREAKGVLLWVRIVIREILVGIASGDMIAELTARVSQLPAELEGDDGLYSFMIKRNARNSKHYLAEASLYLRLACQGLFSIPQYYLSTNDAIRNSYLEFHDGWETLHHKIDCDRIAKAISARTGGLLEVKYGLYPAHLSDRAAQTRCSSVTSIVDIHQKSRVVFIHRTARSYLLETKSGQDLLGFHPGSVSDFERVRFEIEFIAHIQLQCLESVAPVGIDRILSLSEPEGDNLERFKDLVKMLMVKGYLWVEPFRTRWMGNISGFEDAKLPLPVMATNDSQISFAHVFTYLNWSCLTDELQQITIQQEPDYLLSLLFSTFLHAYRDRNDCLALVRSVCKWIVSSKVDLAQETINIVGERTLSFHQILFAYHYFEYNYGNSMFPSVEIFLGRTSQDVGHKKCQPLMTDCSSLFFVEGYANSAFVFGAVNPEEIRALTGLRDARDVPKNFMSWKAQSTSHTGPCGMRIICAWKEDSWIPQMYAIALDDYLQFLAHFSPFLSIITIGLGIIRVNLKVKDMLKKIVRSNIHISKVESLLSAFRLLGKSEASIESFLAVEEPRIRRTYDNVISSAWLSWLHGTEATFSHPYQSFRRPGYLGYSVPEEYLKSHTGSDDQDTDYTTDTDDNNDDNENDD